MTQPTTQSHLSSLQSKILHAPKAELHVHLEGTIGPETLMALSARNHIKVPYENAEEVRAAYNFKDLSGFLQLYYSALGVLVTRLDFYEVTYTQLKRAAEDRVVYVEFYMSPQSHIERGIGLDTVLGGVAEAIADARADFGIDAKLIFGLQRHRTEAEAFEALEAARPFKESFVAVGLGGVEKGNPPSKFERAFRQAKNMGWPITIHAGEEGPPSYIWEALDVVGADRIDHGVTAQDDPRLIERLAADQIPMTVCPLSNICLNVFPSLEQHNLKTLLDAGCRVSVNTDDPPYFNGYMNDNLVAVASALQLSDGDVYSLLRNGFQGSFASTNRKNELVAGLDKFWLA
ncbi:Adenine deaminase [Variovorax sp. PBS-H4]|uniref:adenosine deaminase n=1 Tax=Variovorax sp. PBS-H4 TaxID=434008 RepID=UPI001317AEFC|nr:adenosine deaminase [Variovorax sp. PBS-H4]VTU40259.1 Adenine deaminase [Variovorax sp. PBS-H4]